VSIDVKNNRAFCLVESVVDFDGVLRGYVAEFDESGRFLRCARLPSRFKKANKGFEGLAHVRHKGREHLYALREAAVRTKTGLAGRIDVYVRHRGGAWKASHFIQLPEAATFKDYSALAYRDQQMAIVSQQSARLWVARLHQKTHAIIPGSEAIYRFPDGDYGTVEGIDWLSADTLVAVSDRKKKRDPKNVRAKDQSIHLFRIPR
jgi:hypothetical protein